MGFIKLTWRRLLAALVALLMLSAAGFVVWASMPAGDVMPAAQAALESSDEVLVTDRAWLAFFPTGEPAGTGYVFYPGAKVPPEAYAPYARRIADAGFLVVIVRPPFHLAILNPGVVEPVLDTYSGVDHWAIGGHSLGGAVASQFAAGNPERVQGLVLLGARPAGDTLAGRDDLAAVSIYGTRDAISTPDEVLPSRSRMPPGTRFIAIDGGNHSQFGYYGLQSGDASATIPRDEQIRQSADATLQLLRDITP
jgi:predicted alpha/beta-hydrolase family hydrolase